MNGRQPYVEMDAEQRKLLVDTRQLWDAWKDAEARRRRYEGSLSWQISKGNEYLVKHAKDPLTGIRKSSSLGPKNEETEEILRKWTADKEEAKARLVALNERMSRQARFNKAVGIARVPDVAAKVLRLLDRQRLLGRNVIVAGTNALYAYEAAAGILVGRELLATGDLDLLMDARSKLKLSVEGIEPAKIIDVLKAADRTFEITRDGGYSAVNADGYAVDLIKPEPSPPWKEEREKIGEGDLVASPIPNLVWLANSSKFEAIAVAADGRPVPMVCPDPRAFALYKRWLGKEASDRDPVKRERDIQQAYAVASIVANYLPKYPFEAEHLKAFPRHVIEAASEGGDPFFNID